jgi:hypothetical protein
MSFLARIAARAAPVSRASPVLMPKDAGLRRAAAPEEEMPDDEMQAQRAVRRLPIRRAELEQQDQELSRQADEQDQDEPVARQETEEEPEAQRVTPRPDEDDEMPPTGGVSRQAEDDDDANLRPARPLTSEDMSPENQRLPDEVAGEPEPPDLRALRRAELPEDEAEPEAARAPAEMAEDEDDANMRPLRRAVGPIAASATAPATPSMAVTDMVDGPDAAIDVSGDYWRPGLDDGMFGGRNLPAEDFAIHGPAPAPSPASFGRPQVIIDQLDVVIHEPVAAPSRSSRFDAGRALRARYLRRL